MICRLCLKDIGDVINIFDQIGLELDVASVLTKYFWFEPKSDDPISTVICNLCWDNVSNFHKFYLNVEVAHRLLTERFSLKTEPNKTPLATSKHDLMSDRSATNYNEDHQIEDTETQERNNDLMEVDESSSDAEIKFHRCSDEFFDGEMLMESFLNDSADEHAAEEAVQKIKNEQPPLEVSNVRRSTRSNTKLQTFTSISNQKSNSASKGKLNTEGQGAAKPECRPIKRQRGRPRKINPKNTPTNNKRVAISSKPSSNRISELELANLPPLEMKVREVDAKIKQHMRLTCDVCATEVCTFAQLRRHFEKEHHFKGYAVCCNKKFYKRALLIDHIEKHLNPDCYKCNECDKVFADKQCMRNHFLLKHQPDEVKIFECEHCPKKYAKSYLLDQHRVVHEARTHICDLCAKGFASAALLGTHIKVVHMNYGTMCDICAKVIRGRAAFEKHQLEHTGKTQPKVQCDKCGSWHKDKYNLQKHKRRHNEEGIIHICNICEKVAPNRSALRSHYRYVHAAKRTFECGVCNKAFKKAINLKEHMTLHTGEVLYKCPYCTRTFNSNANMHSHRKKMHPKEFEETRKKRRDNLSKAEHQKVPPAMNENVMPHVITIKTAEDGEMHQILVTTEDFNDPDEAPGDKNSIIFTMN